jgi:hypothetical protein
MSKPRTGKDDDGIDIETVLAWYRREMPNPSKRAHLESFERRAYEIGSRGKRFQKQLAENPSLKGPLYNALLLGAAIGDAALRFGKFGKARDIRTEMRRVQIVALADKLRRTTPYDQEHSQHWLADVIGQRLDVPAPTVRRILIETGRR